MYFTKLGLWETRNKYIFLKRSFIQIAWESLEFLPIDSDLGNSAQMGRAPVHTPTQSPSASAHSYKGCHLGPSQSLQRLS